MRYHEICDEAFSDLGRISPDKLIKGQPLTSPEQFKQVDHRTFAKVISHIRANDFANMNGGIPNKGLHTLHVYTIGEYAEMRCYLGENNSSGFALHGDELVSVFSSRQSSANALVQRAIKEGAKRLDCIAFRDQDAIYGPLFKLYSRFGFKIDTSLNKGRPGEAYSIQNGISEYEGGAPGQVVVFMRHP